MGKKAEKPEKLSKRAEEARKKELVHGEGSGRSKVLESLHCAGILASRETSVDVKFEQVSMSIHGKDIINDATVEINYGQRYGMIGANGCGKSTILAALAARELPIPDHIDIWFVSHEAEPTKVSAMDTVVDTARKEVARLEELIMKLSEEDPEGNGDVIEALGDKLDKMDPSTFVPEAAGLLCGLGFTEGMMHKNTEDMSGGWRMRVALAQALFKRPTLLILDEPTNHLDLGACVWLEEYLAKYHATIILTSHSEDFMNAVCTSIMQITGDQRLRYWGGNYDAYVQTRRELEVNQVKAYEKEQTDIKHLEEFIRSCGTYSNMRKQADSKQKIIDKLNEKGLVELPLQDPKFKFNFLPSEKLPPPVLAFDSMSFSYSGQKKDYLFNNINFGVDLDSCIAIVGPNGAGKSTLLKLMRGDLEPCEGTVKRHSHLRIASYTQHSVEVLDMEKSPLQFMADKFDAEDEKKGQKRSEQEWRGHLGKYGVVGDLQKRKMGTFSDGQKARVVFALMSLANPHLLLLDEPTNHLDMTCIDALGEAILAFTGGTVLVSHDFRLIEKVVKDIWVVDGKVTPWKGDIKSYKKDLSKNMKKAAKARMASMGSCAGAKTGGGKQEESDIEEEKPAPPPKQEPPKSSPKDTGAGYPSLSSSKPAASKPAAKASASKPAAPPPAPVKEEPKVQLHDFGDLVAVGGKDKTPEVTGKAAKAKKGRQKTFLS